MNIALIFENATSYAVEQRQVICWNALQNMNLYCDGSVTYHQKDEFVPTERGNYKLIGLGWWRYSEGAQEGEIPGGRTDHITCKSRKTIKEQAIVSVLHKERQKSTRFGEALKYLGCYAFVSADWPISVAVSYLQGYRNTSNFFVRIPEARHIFERQKAYYGGLKSWIPIWDLICNDGTDSSIVSFAGDAAIKRIAKAGYLSNKKLFKNGNEKMTATGFYRKGDQTSTIIENINEVNTFTLQQEGSKHKNYIVKCSQILNALHYSNPTDVTQGLINTTPAKSIAWLIAEVLR